MVSVLLLNFLLIFPYDGNTAGSYNPHKTAMHNHGLGNRVSGLWSNSPIYGFSENGSSNYAFSNLVNTGLTGDNETAGAWLAVDSYISY